MVGQIRRELQRRGINNDVVVELVGFPEWVSVHVPRRDASKRAFIGDRRGQMISLRFAVSVTGPTLVEVMAYLGRAELGRGAAAR